MLSNLCFLFQIRQPTCLDRTGVSGSQSGNGLLPLVDLTLSRLCFLCFVLHVTDARAHAAKTHICILCSNCMFCSDTRSKAIISGHCVKTIAHIQLYTNPEMLSNLWFLVQHTNPTCLDRTGVSGSLVSFR